MRTILFSALAVGCIWVLPGCGTVDNTPIGKGVKTYEKYSDDIGRERDVKVMGKDVIIEPEADKKIRFNF
ncbi:MAG: hypothetical protein NT045_06685 [Candidatus Aureabacteria bacterium]|nr:hypothetical protein [Candidatus Auribacterota bacterium]